MKMMTGMGVMMMTITAVEVTVARTTAGMAVVTMMTMMTTTAGMAVVTMMTIS